MGRDTKIQKMVDCIDKLNTNGSVQAYRKACEELGREVYISSLKRQHTILHIDNPAKSRNHERAGKRKYEG